jgi:hypothetical protein
MNSHWFLARNAGPSPDAADFSLRGEISPEHLVRLDRRPMTDNVTRS